MKLNINLCCSICGAKHQIIVPLPFNADDVECLKCGGCNCLNIVSVANPKIELPRPSPITDLMKLRQL